jgi:hypothetical protein
MDMVEKLGKQFRNLPIHVGPRPVDHVSSLSPTVEMTGGEEHF